MKTHLSFDGYCVKSMWSGPPPDDARRTGAARLVNPRGHYEGCPYVTAYHSPTQGYGHQA